MHTGRFAFLQSSTIRLITSYRDEFRIGCSVVPAIRFSDVREIILLERVFVRVLVLLPFLVESLLGV